MSERDNSMCVTVLSLAAAMSWVVLSGKPLTITVPAPAGGAAEVPAPDQRVRALAHAIAVAEGYYAPGPHDGRSLPHRLNNPGGLKKPALSAETLPTWKDTGLVIFPTAEAGWAALHHQVRLMLNGQSRVYQLSDTLLLAAEKYADGDSNWGHNVAARLGVSPDATLADLAPQER